MNKITPIGPKVDRLYALRSKLADAKAVADRIERDYDALHDELLDTLIGQKQPGAHGKAGSVSIVENLVGEVKDWDAVWHFAVDNDAPDLFHRRLGQKAWKDRRDAGVVVPGIEAAMHRKLMLRPFDKGTVKAIRDLVKPKPLAGPLVKRGVRR